MNRTVAVALVAALALSGLVAWALFASPGPAASTTDQVTVAYSPFESSGLFVIAEDRQLFAEHGLNLTLVRSESGADALDDLLAGRADLAVSVSEFPLVRKVLSGTTARALASIDRAEYIYIVARKDRDIEEPADLAGKRIGTASGSIAQFHLGRFLANHGLRVQQVRYVAMKNPSETADAVVDGDLDAAVLAQPYADRARERLGANAVDWPAQSDQPFYALVVSTDDWLARHPALAQRFLASLAGAEAYVAAHPAESMAIVERRLDLEPGYAETVWRQNQFSVSLDQSLVEAMEDEARWLIENNLTNATAVPDLGTYIDTAALERVRPESVGVFR